MLNATVDLTNKNIIQAILTVVYVFFITIIISVGTFLRGKGGSLTIGKSGIKIDKFSENLTLDKQMTLAQETAVIIKSQQFEAVKKAIGFKENSEAERVHKMGQDILIDEQLDLLRSFFLKNGFAKMSEDEYYNKCQIQKQLMYGTATVTSRRVFIESIMGMSYEESEALCSQEVNTIFNEKVDYLLKEARVIALAMKGK